MATSIDIAPLIPLWLIISLSVLALGAAGVGAILRLNGWLWRGLAAIVIAAALLNPSLVREERDPLTDIAVLVTDSSQSMQIGGRAAAAEAQARWPACREIGWPEL